MKMQILLPVLATIAAVSPAWAQPCSAVDARFTIAKTLRLAAEQRPVNVMFRTTAEGVKLPDYLKLEHPDEMTIILQHQFGKLNVKDDRFDVVLWFKRKPERLIVPFHAIKAFWDNAELKCFND